MGWLDDLSKLLESGETSGPDAPPPPPPTFTVGPRPFGVGREVAGVEWQTDQRTSGVVRYRAAGTETWGEAADDSRQRDHQRTLTALSPDTEYQVEVTAIVPKRGAVPATRALSLRTLPTAAPQPEAPPIQPDDGTPETPSATGDPIPHPPATLNVLAEQRVWLPGTLTQVDPAFTAWLRRYCVGGPTRLVLADLRHVPDRMRQAGFRGRDNALWYTLSRSYAGWNWPATPGDPDYHLTNQRRELHDVWSNYIDVVGSVMAATPQTTAVILDNDGPDRCGKTLGEYTERQLSAVRARVELGHYYQD